MRELHAQGQVDAAELLESELRSYHAPGTCTFYGTANTNQLVMEALGLHLPGASFVTSGTTLRRALTEAAGRRIVELTDPEQHAPIGRVVDERAIVNAIVALLATGGSTNHTMHLVAMAAAAGINLTWRDFAELSHGRAAAGADLPQRQRRHQPVPGGRRDRQPVQGAARRRSAARGRD